MPDDNRREERVRQMSEALRIAVGVADEGAETLSGFLKRIKVGEPPDGAQAAAAPPPVVADELAFAARSGRLANDALSIALDVALAAKSGMEENGQRYDENLSKLSQLLGFAGSVFIETANKAVGTAAGQPTIDRARQVTVEVTPGGKAPQSVWVVNRGAATVTGAQVEVLGGDADNGFSVVPDLDPPILDLDPRERKRVRLTVSAGPEARPGSFVDALLVVRGVASIVVRTVVKEAPAKSVDKGAPGSTDPNGEAPAEDGQ
jgi:hypothetical protein